MRQDRNSVSSRGHSGALRGHLRHSCAGRQREGDRALSRDDLGPDVQSRLSRRRSRRSAVERRSAAPRTSRSKAAISVSAPASSKAPIAQLPRYFADADKVMDLEQRLLWCMQNIQGLDTKDVVARRFSGPGRASDMEDLVAYIANKSNGMKIDIPLSHPKEQEMAAVGEALFYRRGGVDGFLPAPPATPTKASASGCRDCRTSPSPARRRRKPWAAGRPIASRRARCAPCSIGCGTAYRQQRWPVPEYGSDALTALTSFLQKQAAAGEINVPSIKR